MVAGLLCVFFTAVGTQLGYQNGVADSRARMFAELLVEVSPELLDQLADVKIVSPKGLRLRRCLAFRNGVVVAEFAPE